MRAAPKLLIIFVLYALATSACDSECRPHAQTVCMDGITHFTDSCGELQEAIEVCGCGCNPDYTACGTCTCEAQCEGRECGPDGCGGWCNPGCQPGDLCDENGRCQTCYPDCEAKRCGPDGCGGLCGPGCEGNELCNPFGQCETCQADCTERQCGPDGCGGQCDPGCDPEQTCDGLGQCQACQPDCAGRECGPDACGGQCDPGCDPEQTCDGLGQCQVCQPDCAGRECGPDGCGGQCEPGCGAEEACDGIGTCQQVACGQGAPIQIAGAFATDVAQVTFDTASVALTHKRDVDPWEDGCITTIELTLNRGPGCQLHLLAGGQYTPAGGLKVMEIAFTADSFCPNFPDDTEGIYGGLGGLAVAEVVPGVAEVPGDNLAEACVATSLTLRLEGELFRNADGVAIGVEATQIQIAGAFQSNGDIAVSCPCQPQCGQRQCGDDGCGDLCGSCQANEHCTQSGLCQAPTATTCWTGQAYRDKIVPQVGDLVISEVMANPESAADATAEWFEIWVTADVDINGLAWGRDPDSAILAVPEGDCQRVQAGSRLLMAKSADPAENGALPDPDGIFPFHLINTGGTLYLGFYDQDLDLVGWDEATSGVASQLDPANHDPVLNDDAFYWCDAEEAYGIGDLGSPGTPNSSCNLPIITCTEGGLARPKLSPDVGDLVITEFMPDPTWVSDAQGEWFEVLVTRELDLNGLMAGRSSLTDELVPEGECVRVAAGSRLIFARESDSQLNGGLPFTDGTFSFNLINADGNLVIGLSGLPIDAIQYAGTSAGTAMVLDPDFEDATANDNAANWCHAVNPYNPGDDLGSPGFENAQCP